MLIYMFSLNWLFSTIFMFMNHPLSLGCILLIQTILISLSSGMLYFNFWFSYILFLIMIGGMLVMFIYMTSIASNEKFKMPKMMTIYCFFSFIILLIMITFSDNYYSNLISINSINLNQSLTFMNNSLSKFFNYPNMQMMIILMIYLLVTLIAIVKIVGRNTGTLRQK
uniref:NADH-ubiquinone oxidoreductase chain 6 n=1 Tax=Pimelocerus perforatus TaxID=1585529 RepID=A0A7S6PW29_9CUCU|nr:NADH dehydrogenase subunit 6 [Pimelocerus perforatus]QOU11172.1 NADH dehydrogenase subunit 6 [Pimelocerus perforatus]